MRTFLATIALVLSLSSANALTISTIDTGGNIATYLRFWRQVADTGETVTIDAPCISACSFFLGLVPPSRVCITPRGSIGLHQINDGTTSDPVMSMSFFRWLYPIWVQQWVKDHGGLQTDPIYMYPEDLKGHIDLCPGYQYDPVAPEELVHQQPSMPFPAPNQ